MKFKVQPYNLQELGQRQNQEDSLFPGIDQQTSDDRLFILCDGMGGHEKGEVASATVCETMSNTILSRWNPSEPLSDELLQQAIADAYDQLDNLQTPSLRERAGEKLMGTTMTFVCFHADGVTVAHIGDSRVYQLRPATKKEPARIVFQTRDHSLVNDLIKIGEITEEEAKTHPQKNVITRAMQPCQEHRAKADIAHLTDIREGDYFYMCSDGMLEQTTDDNLLFIITNPKASDKEKVEMLRDVTSENKDNHTAHLIRVDKVEGTVSAPASLPESQSTEPQGVLVTPESPKPRSKSLYLIVAAVVIALVAIAASFFLFPSQTESDEAETDSTKVDSIQHPTAIHAPKDTTKHDTVNVAASKQNAPKDSIKKDSAKAKPTDKFQKFIKQAKK